MRARRSLLLATAGAALAALSLPAEAEDALPPGFVWPPALVAPSAPPDAIPGYYDPATKQFQPLAAPAAQTKTYQMTFSVPLAFKFKTSSAADWATINCQASVSYRAANGSISRTDTGSEGFGGITPDPHISTKQTITTNAEANPRGYLTVQCTAYDDAGHGYSTSQVKSFAIANGTVTVPFTFTLP